MLGVRNESCAESEGGAISEGKEASDDSYVQRLGWTWPFLCYVEALYSD